MLQRFHLAVALDVVQLGAIAGAFQSQIFCVGFHAPTQRGFLCERDGILVQQARGID